jgi:dTDP-4-amino-4,6-dideoxygalactose transaminase
MDKSIPLINLDRQHAEIHSEISAAIDRVISKNAYILGHEVSAFEEGFSALLGDCEVIGCTNGTIGLELALRAAGVQAGSEVITSSHSFIATAEAIVNIGAVPVFVDVEPRRYTIDPNAIEQAITSKTQAIVPVHIYGTTADMTQIMEIAGKYGLLVIEDAAQAHLASCGGAMAGTIGDAASFSFFPGKNLGAMGDAGAVVTRTKSIADKARLLRNHGRRDKYLHEVLGYNYRMDGLQGAILAAKLPHLPAWTERRRQVASRYDDALAAEGFKLIEVPEGMESAYHLYVVQVSNREHVMVSLAEKGIASGVHYPVPQHQQPALEGIYGVSELSLPITENLCPRVISLPICGAISDAEVDQVIQAFLEVAQR